MRREYVRTSINHEGKEDSYNGDISLGIVHRKGFREFEESKARRIISSHGHQDSRYHFELCRCCYHNQNLFLQCTSWSVRRSAMLYSKSLY